MWGIGPVERGTDEALMRRVAEGDSGAFEALVHRHSASLYRFAFRIVGHEDAAQDVVQETFLRLWRHAGKYEPSRPFKTWLYTIARRVALNAARSASARRAREMEEESAIEDVADLRPTAEEVLSSWQRQEAVRRALAALAPRQRMALVLHHYEGMSYQEIGQVMGVRVSAVESLIFRARRALASALGDVLGEKG